MLFNNRDTESEGLTMWSVFGMALTFVCISYISCVIVYFTVITIPLFMLHKSVEFIGWCVGLII